MASKFAWLAGKRGLILAIATLASVLLGAVGHVSPTGVWDGPG